MKQIMKSVNCGDLGVTPQGNPANRREAVRVYI